MKKNKNSQKDKERKMKMEKRNVITNVIVTAVAGIFIFCGCAAQKAEMTGFLSNYSNLEPVSDTSYRYIAPGNKLGGYSKFIIDPVGICFYSASKAKLKEEDLTDIKNYMHEALVKAIEDRYEIVHRPGSGTARMRVAITDLKKSGIVQNVLPLTKLAGTGLGGASVEAELIDSQSNEQLGALVESQQGERLSLDGYSTWGDAKAIMNGWAKRFRDRIDEAH